MLLTFKNDFEWAFLKAINLETLPLFAEKEVIKKAVASTMAVETSLKESRSSTTFENDFSNSPL